MRCKTKKKGNKNKNKTKTIKNKIKQKQNKYGQKFRKGYDRIGQMAKRERRRGRYDEGGRTEEKDDDDERGAETKADTTIERRVGFDRDNGGDDDFRGEENSHHRGFENWG